MECSLMAVCVCVVTMEAWPPPPSVVAAHILLIYLIIISIVNLKHRADFVCLNEIYDY